MKSLKRFTCFMLAASLVLAALPIFSPLQPAFAQDEQPKSVTIAGTLQAQLGCPGDWQPECDKTFLTYDEEDGVWQGKFELKAGEYEYKVAIDGAWTENYGGAADKDGPNVKIKLAEDGAVRFYYDHKTHWVADSVGDLIATAPGSYQSEIGCSKSGVAGDWDPSCLRSWLQDPDGDGKYTFTTNGLLAGDYEVKVAIDESWGLNYGALGARDGGNIGFTIPSDNKEVLLEWDSESKILTVNVEGAPKKRVYAAHWVARDLILWDAKDAGPDTVYKLLASSTASIVLGADSIEGVEKTFDLAPSADPIPDAVLAEFPHLANLSAIRLPEDAVAAAKDLLRGQLFITASAPDGTLLDVAGLQIPGVLDDLYAAAAEKTLGLAWDGDVPVFNLWAPTAQSVVLLPFETATKGIPMGRMDMTRDDETGIWTYRGDPAWKNGYYLFEVTVFAPTTNAIERNLVTDPYSLSLATNSLRSQIVDLSDPALKPEGWDAMIKPTLEAPEDIVIYELHVRDFSIFDQTVPEDLRGKFLAFTVKESNGMKHLAALAQAGLTHLHILPFFDIATIDELRKNRSEVLLELLQRFPPDSPRQQELIANNKERDAFNWGYDPFHYNAPEGSYATDPMGSARVLEARQMVQALNDTGLRVVMDVVYNHTNASGQNPKSVLDKVVPGYYHRLNGEGKVERSTCCENTATEHRMMEKLMIDSVVLWATQYKIDAFRFDLMGHHMKANMVNLRAALDGLTLEKDGVDGKSIYVYGEGWNFGEVKDNAQGVNATQINLFGTGIGTFSDRLRDAVRGGSPFGDRQKQGFVNGLYDDPNATTDQGLPEEQKARLMLFGDQIMLGMAGNLRDYKFIDRSGSEVTGADIDYNGAPAGYTADPQEHIVYAEKHDNETLWDLIAYKAPISTSMADRVRMQNLGVGIVTLSQGVPFIHAGMDMLRSKNMDRDSYDSGDWFNRLDFSYETNNWAAGLPIADKNKDMWDIMGPLLADPALKPAKEDILKSVANFQEMLQIRKSTALFRLRTAEDIQARVKFLNTGPEMTPGAIVMLLDNRENPIDDPYSVVVVVVNATKTAQVFTYAELAGLALELHPVQADGADEVVKMSKIDGAAGELTVPARTLAVFVVKAAGR